MMSAAIRPRPFIRLPAFRIMCAHVSITFLSPRFIVPMLFFSSGVLYVKKSHLLLEV